MSCFADSFGGDAAVFWSPQASAHVLPVTAMEQSVSQSEDAFEFAALPCRKTIIDSGDGVQHILLQDDIGRVQLSNDGVDMRRADSVQVNALWPKDQIRRRLCAIECVNAITTAGRFPARLFQPDRRDRRLRSVLRALDGSLAGLSHREIAEALFGEERVMADWSDPRDHLRDQIRRAVGRGRALMNGGYKDFLS